jgi:hypothetical protein
MRSRHVASRLAAAALWVTSGCVTYVAQIGKEQRGDVHLVVESAHSKLGHGPWRDPIDHVMLRVERVPRGIRLLEARLSSPSAEPCPTEASFGEEADVLLPDAPGPVLLTDGERVRLEARFRRPGAFLTSLDRGGRRLDLQLQTAEGTLQCVPIVIVDAGEELSWSGQERFTVGYQIVIETALVSSVRSVINAPIALGVWLAGWHVEAAAGFTVSYGCPRSGCPEPTRSDSLVNYGFGYSLAAGVGRPFYEWEQFSFGANAAYRALRLEADIPDGHETFWMQHAVLVPYFGFAVERIRPGVGGARNGLWAIEIPVGYGWTRADGRSPTVGLSMRAQFTVF